MQGYIDYLKENQSAKELIDALEEEVFDDVVSMTLLNIDGEEAYEIGEPELEDIISIALDEMLAGREIAHDFIMECCALYKTTLNEMLDEGFILEYKDKFYERDNEQNINTRNSMA